MLYDRPYMRQPVEPAAKQTSIAMTLLIVTVGVFVLQNVMNVFFPGIGGQPNYFLGDWFALSGPHFKELKVWTVVSYSFLHSTHSFLHILGNMLGLFFLGRVIEQLIGKRQFLLLYLGGALFGGLVYILFNYNSTTSVIGASGAIMALLAFFCLLRPEQPITLLLFFIIPITVKPKWVFRASIAISVLGVIFYELPAISNPQYHSTSVAHSAHLGGLFAGILFFRFIYSGSQSFFRSHSTRPSVELPEWFKRHQKAEPKVTYKVNRSEHSNKSSSRDQLQAEVDRILDKINESEDGIGSLTAGEKRTLDQAKDILTK